jgi:hypothetical protein
MVNVPMGLYIKIKNELYSIHYIKVSNTHCSYKASLHFSLFALVASFYEQTTCVHQIWLGFPTYFPNLQTMVLVHSMSHKNVEYTTCCHFCYSIHFWIEMPLNPPPIIH